MRIVVKEPGKPAEVREVDGTDTLKAMQQVVGGYVEIVPVAQEVYLLCNEDGISLNLPDNCGYAGTLAFVREGYVPGADGDRDWVSLTNEDVRKALTWLALRDGQVHPDRSGKFTIVSGAEQQRGYLTRLAAHRREAQAEWDKL